jgi:hypothetical protein
MLDSHRDIVAPPETKLGLRLATQMHNTLRAAGPVLQAEHGVGPAKIAIAYGAVIRLLLDDIRRRAGALYVVDKTPSNVLGFSDLQHMLPDSPLIHLLRDGRDVVASLLAQSWKDLDSGRPLPRTRDPRAAAAHWVRSVQAARSVAPGRLIEVRYEALVARPQQTLQALMDRLGIPFDPRMLQHHTLAHTLPATEASSGEVTSAVHMRSVGRWRERLDDDARAAVAEVAGPLLVALGYAEDDGWVQA